MPNNCVPAFVLGLLILSSTGTACLCLDVIRYGVTTTYTDDGVRISTPSDFGQEPQRTPEGPRIIHVSGPSTVGEPAPRPSPLAILLRDVSLRRGDIVMFPDGARVFVGRQRDWHAVSDFQPVRPNMLLIPHDTRAYVERLRPNTTDSWPDARLTPSGLQQVSVKP